MDAEYKIYENGLVEEAQKIEQAFVQERSELIRANYKELDRLLQTRKVNES
jgi:dynein regulatry complex protein 1